MTVRTFLPLSIALFASLAAPGCAADDQADQESFAQDRCNDENVVCEAYGRAPGYQSKPEA
jgi:hypothetical protein